MRQTTFTQKSKYAVINLIDESIEYFETIEEAREFQKDELEYWNLFEKQEPYDEDDICIETVDEE